ncbi:MAG: ATP-binding protein [bacterium]
MKKIILEILQQHYEDVVENWVRAISDQLAEKLSESQIRTFVESTLIILMDIIENSDYLAADQYLIDNYNLFNSAQLNLLEISQLFTQCRYAVFNVIEKNKTYQYDPVILLGFIDSIIEQIFARYGMLHQQALMRELTQDRDRLASKLDQNQEYLKSILHSTDSAILMVDEDEKIIAWNKSAEKIFGYKEEEVLGKGSSFLFPPGENYEKELQYIKSETKRRGYVKIDETERLDKKGRAISVELNVSKLPGKNGNYSGRSIIIKDKTEVKKLQEQVDQSEKLAVIGQLAAGVAHEIGNPLASISSLIQILQRKTSDDFLSEQYATIKENIDRITKIVRELVDFSRPPSYENQPTQITDVIKTAIGIVKYDKRVKKVQFITEYDYEMPVIKIVPDQLLQVFVNILINALDAMAGQGNISVRSFHDDNFASIEIKDSGCGMTKEVMDKIFNPFFTTKEVGKGTGLGLSVSYGIVKKFNGEILVDSEQGKGSIFTIKLPVVNNVE